MTRQRDATRSDRFRIVLKGDRDKPVERLAQIELDDAFVYVYAAASTIGHEMTHGFDAEGRKFDGTGTLADWWTKEDAAKFEAQAGKLNAQYDTYSPFPGVHVKGAQTTGKEA